VSPCNMGRLPVLSVVVLSSGGGGGYEERFLIVAVNGVVGNGEPDDVILRPPHLLQRILSLVALVGEDLFLCRG
jgi:hypothetical protein